MTAANRVQAIVRWVAVALMAIAVLTATASGFAQSYAGLYHWALDHGLTGWKAQSFPLLVDLFIIVGELGLFLLAIDAYVIHRRNMLSWLDFVLPLSIAMAGWTASLIFNVGHVGRSEFSYQATAAVPPIVSMLGLFVLLRTLHRYVSQKEDEAGRQPRPLGGGEAPRALNAPVTLQQITFMPMRVTGPIPQVGAGRTDKAIESGTAAGRAAQATAEADPAPAAAEAPAARAAEPAPAPAPKPGRSPRHAAPEPAPELAVVGAAARASVNGHGEIDANALKQPALTPEPDAPAVNPENLRNAAMTALEQHEGDLAATLEAVRAEGYTTSEDEIRRIRDNHWFPYAVYRLLAKHKGDGALVRQELTERGIEFDSATLEALVRSWRA
ncbi:DUF2637 domain-containing protein [Thermomonospora amylolytica]|uniref:DUF2637 domain-containing protein n=1 Tax=Thermomonospora amylolytica TaxID=1411117 RepID=UPI000E6C2838|nr:DUF2637 domain-containing protein [Thermomonospora amylolytica]